MGDSLMIGGCKLGMDVRLCGPRRPVAATTTLVDDAAARSPAQTGARLTLTDDVGRGRQGRRLPLHRRLGLDGRGHGAVWHERIKLLKPVPGQRVTSCDRTGNPAVKFMHCLPAFHNRDTAVGEEIFQQFGLDGLEVTDEVFESERSIVFDQAENRLHTIKAVMVATLGS